MGLGNRTVKGREEWSAMEAVVLGTAVLAYQEEISGVRR
jgi:hypothetical protein